MSKQLFHIVLLLAACASAPLRASDVISVDFVYSDTGIGPITGDTTLSAGPKSNTTGLIFTGQIGSWNPVTTGSNNGNNTIASAGSLLNGNGVASGVSFTMNAAGSWRGNFTTTAAPILRQGSGLANTAESAYLYNGVLTGSSLTWTIAGLTPNAIYNLAFYGDGSVPGGTTHTANGIAGVLDSQLDWNWAMLSANGSGTIQGVFTAPSPTSGITGFQLQAIPVAAVPEPGSFLVWTLLAVAGAAWGFRRVRRRS